MYHEEKVINGILCYRTTPTGEWKEFTKQELTERITKYRKALEDINTLAP